jgi:hypothetical protein
MLELTYISTVTVTNYANIADLKVVIIKTLARWFPQKYVFNEDALESWVKKEGTDIDVLYSNSFQFELSIKDENLYQLKMYANGRLRRQGSSCDFFEMILECLEFQIKHPERDFDTMIDCHEEDEEFYESEADKSKADESKADESKADENKADENKADESEADESEADENIMNMPLHEMNDVQIEKYIERIGRCPRDECEEWAMVYNGGPIIRYSYCNFSQSHIEDQTVSNVTITRAIFNKTTFTNCVFDNVTFDECDFMDVILNNTTFKNSKFIEGQLDSRVPDKSCEVVKYKYNDDDDYDHIHITYYYY